MDFDPVFLSRLQFAFLISFHIIFPSFTIGLAAWLATIEGARLATGNPLYRRVFDFWLKVFAVSFGMGGVTGIVMAFQFCTNWGVLAQKAGSIQGPLLGYEAFTAFMLEATFFGVMLLGRDRVSPRFYFFACCMVSLGTMFSSFWILANNSWMQVPLGHTIVDGRIIPADWREIVLGPVMMVRWPHMLLAAFLTTGMCVAATGAWYVLRGVHSAQARVMLHWGLGLVTVMIPIQLFFGHVTGLYVLKHQPANFAAIEARWKTQQSASEVLLAIPDEKNERNLFAIEIPKLFSLACYVLVLARSNWQTRPWGLAFPAIGVLALVGIFFGARQKRDGWPFAMTTLLFVAAFLSLGVMLWPYMIPYSITVADAAAPEASLRFLFYGGVVVLPVIAAYTIGVYWVFRGKVRKGYGQMTVGRS